MAERISVIVPVYNVAADLPRCLDSILGQTYADIEIIAVDDGSPDNSGMILDQYAARHPNIRVIHKVNGGVTSARLRGVQEAAGEWIGFVDGDDEIEPDMYERLLNNAQKYHAQISHCGYRMVFADGRVNYFHNTGVLESHDKTRALRELLSGERIEPGLWNKLFHLSLFQGLEMDESIKINEDLLMNFYLFSAADTSVYDDWCPYHYIVRKGSASRASLNTHKIYDPIKVKKIILENCNSENMVDARKAFLATCVYTYCGLLLAQGTKEYLKNVRKEILSHKAWMQLLSKRTKLLAELIVFTPALLRMIYPIYVKYFQKTYYN